MIRISCLAISVLVTLTAFSQSTKSVKTTTTKPVPLKPAVPKPVFKNLCDSASYTAGIHIVNKFRSQNIFNFNGAVVARAVNDLQTGKPQLIKNEDADNVIIAYQEKLKTKTKSIPQKAIPGVALHDLRDSASYVAGIYLVNFFRDFDIFDFNSSVITRAINDLQSNKPRLLNDSLANIVAMRYQYKLQEIKNKSTIEAGEKFLEENKKRKEVIVTKSGLQYEIITQGTGKIPMINEKVSCNYTGAYIDGNEFNNSYKMGGPITFAVNGVIKGWTEALLMMPVGSKWKLYVPYTLAYGPGQYQTIPGGSTLVFEIELLGVVDK